jgi:chorismate mutase-like protein
MPTSATSGTAAGAPPANDNPEALAVLQALRDELDGIDWRLMEALRQRLDCCCRIGLHKRDHEIPMMQPQRIGIVQQRAAEFAANHGICGDFLRSFYALIIEETCRLELEVIAAPADAFSG